MKKLILSVLTLLPMVGFAQKTFTITADIGHQNDPEKVYLLYFKSGNETKVDSATVKGGHFFFKETLDSASLFRLWMTYKGDGPGTLPFFIKGHKSMGKVKDVLTMFLTGDDVLITSPDSLKNAKVTGSLSNDSFKELTAKATEISILNERLYQIRKGTIKVSDEELAGLKKDSIVQAQLKVKAVKNVMSYGANPNMGLQILEMTLSDGGNDDTRVVRHPNAEVMAKYGGMMASGGAPLTTDPNVAAHVKIGARFPNLTQPDIDGKPFSFSSLKGKYTLVDFWASWCAPCRAENPNVVKAYNALKDKGLQIVSVSLDASKAAWKAAIAKDGMPWIHVSDLKSFNNTLAVYFGIRAIPTNVLVAPDGAIIAWSLRGQDLDKQLARLMKLE